MAQAVWHVLSLPKSSVIPKCVSKEVETSVTLNHRLWTLIVVLKLCQLQRKYTDPYSLPQAPMFNFLEKLPVNVLYIPHIQHTLNRYSFPFSSSFYFKEYKCMYKNVQSRNLDETLSLSFHYDYLPLLPILLTSFNIFTVITYYLKN